MNTIEESIAMLQLQMKYIETQINLLEQHCANPEVTDSRILKIIDINKTKK